MGGSDLYEIPIEKLTQVGQNRRASSSSSNTKKRRRSSGSTSKENDKRKRISSPSSSLSTELFDIKKIEESVVQNSGLDLSRLTQLFQLFDLQPTTQVAETLVRCLIPQQPRSVPVGVITNLLGGFAKLRVDIQELILQWILAMLSFSGFSDPSELRKFYHLFLHYLPEDKLRPWLCELLYRLTTKENIQTSTINRLTAMAQRVVTNDLDEPWLQMLLGLYAIYDQRTALDIQASSGPPFKIIDQCLLDAFSNLSKKVEEASFTSPFSSSSSLLPPLDLDPLKTRLRSLDLLSNHSLRCQFMFSSKQEVGNQLSDLLAYLFEEELRWKKLDIGRMTRVFSQLFDFVTYTSQFLPIIESFLSHFLQHWTGGGSGLSGGVAPSVELIDYVLGLIAYLPPRSFHVLYKDFLRPLDTIFGSCSVEVKGKIIEGWTKLMENWLRYDWSNSGIDQIKTIRTFAAFVDRVAIMGYLQEQEHELLLHTVLSFADLISSVASHYGIPIVIPPSSYLVNTCLLASSAMPSSRMCGILAKYKLEAEAARTLIKPPQPPSSVTSSSSGSTSSPSSVSTPVSTSYSSEMAVENSETTEDPIEKVNARVWSYCSVLWRNRVHSDWDLLAAAQLTDDLSLPPSVAERVANFPNSNCGLSLTHSLAFAGYTERFLREIHPSLLEEGTDNPSPDPTVFLKREELKLELLETFLSDYHLEGLYEFLYTFIGSLVDRRNPATTNSTTSS